MKFKINCFNTIATIVEIEKQNKIFLNTTNQKEFIFDFHLMISDIQFKNEGKTD